MTHRNRPASAMALLAGGFVAGSVSAVYDKKNEKWKLFTIPYIHPKSSAFPSNHKSGSALWSQPSQIDVQAKHCTTLHFLTITNDPSLEDPAKFNVQYLRKVGR